MKPFRIFLLLSRKGLIAHPGKNTARKLGKVQSLDPTRLLRGFPVSVSSTDRTFGGALQVATGPSRPLVASPNQDDRADRARSTASVWPSRRPNDWRLPQPKHQHDACNRYQAEHPESI